MRAISSARSPPDTATGSGDVRPQVERPLVLRVRGLERERLLRSLGRGQRRRERPLVVARRRPVVGELGPVRRLRGGRGRRVGLERQRALAVEPPPLAGEQLVVGHLGQERVAERVALGSLRRRVDDEDLAGDRRPQRRLEPVGAVGGPGDRDEQVVVDPASRDGDDPEHVVDVLGHRCQAGQEDLPQRRRQAAGRRLGLRQQQLLDEERVAVGSAMDPGHEVRVGRGRPRSPRAARRSGPSSGGTGRSAACGRSARARRAMGAPGDGGAARPSAASSRRGPVPSAGSGRGSPGSRGWPGPTSGRPRSARGRARPRPAAAARRPGRRTGGPGARPAGAAPPTPRDPAPGRAGRGRRRTCRPRSRGVPGPARGRAGRGSRRSGRTAGPHHRRSRTPRGGRARREPRRRHPARPRAGSCPRRPRRRSGGGPASPRRRHRARRAPRRARPGVRS